MRKMRKNHVNPLIVYLREESLWEESISELSRQLGIPRSTTKPPTSTHWIDTTRLSALDLLCRFL